MSKSRLWVGLSVSGFVALAFLAAAPVGVLAGDLEPGSAPGPTMHTLDEIYSIVADTNSKVSGGTHEAAVEKTGQTTCYDAGGNVISCEGTGQDGDIQPGVSWPYPRFTDNADGTVTDNLSSLVWMKNANCGGTKNWCSALSYCNAMVSGTCGLSDGSVAGDWRLPSRKELDSLIDLGRYNPALPEVHPFSSVQNAYYWSSTTYAVTTSISWVVFLQDGNVHGYNKSNGYYVWCVRGGAD